MNLDQFAGQVAEAKALIQGIGGEANIDLGIKGLGAVTAEVAGLKAALNDLNGTVKINTDGLASVAAQMATLAADSKNAADATRDTGNAAIFAAYGWGVLGRDFTLFAGAFGNTALIGRVAGWHIALDAIMESAFALAPALIDLAGGLMSMAPAAQDIYNHLKAVEDVALPWGRPCRL
jgi:hypothetical protein